MGAVALTNPSLQFYRMQNCKATKITSEILNETRIESADATDAANDSLAAHAQESNEATTSTNAALDTIASQGDAETSSVNDALGNFPILHDAATSDANAGLGDYIPKNDAVTQLIDGLLDNYSEEGKDATSDANADLSEYIAKNKDAYFLVDENLTDLQDGAIPQKYRDAMEDSIATTVQKTLGTAVNEFAMRGVLNSSVTNMAINNIARNAADITAQNFLNNINVSQNLAQSKWGDAITTDRENANMTLQQLNNIQLEIDRKANLAQQRYANAGMQANALNNLGAAAEAYMAPSLSLWNASLGMVGANSSALAGIGGKGTTTTTNTQSGGGFLSGLLAGIF